MHVQTASRKGKGGKKTVESHCCSGNGKRELAEKKRNKTKEKEEKKEKKKKKTLHVIVRVCCVTAALYFVDEECVRTNLQPLLMAKWLVTDRW